MTLNKQKLEPLADAISKTHGCDIVFFNGEISQTSSGDFIQSVLSRKRRENLLLVLVTPGGDPDAAFKIGRAMQAHYADSFVYISGWCKSAGTLVAIAANRLFIGARGELGPLDIQIAKTDEIAEMGSGLTVDAAMKTLEVTASRMFINTLFRIRQETGGMIMTRTASELAASMVTKMLEPIFSQIDPLKIGENSRAMNITKAYGARLNDHSKNLVNARSLDYLVSAYPDHGFVIDLEEARALFKRVDRPTDEMALLAEAAGKAALVPENRPHDGKARIEYINSELGPPPRRTKSDGEPNSTPAAKKSRPAKKRANGRSTSAS